jgi:hypothetical protein
VDRVSACEEELNVLHDECAMPLSLCFKGVISDVCRNHDVVLARDVDCHSSRDLTGAVSR